MADSGNIEALIDRLAGDAAPVRRLGSPIWRAVAWLAVAFAVIGGAVFYHGMRPDLAATMAAPGEMMSWIAALVTGIAAAFAAFHLAAPDRSSAWALLPAPVALVWISGLGVGCYADWIRFGPEGISLGDSFDCFLTILALSLLAGLPMLAMLRHARFVRPVATAALAGLAVASLASAGLELFHRTDARIMDVVWHMAAVALVVAVSSATGGVSAGVRRS